MQRLSLGEAALALPAVDAQPQPGAALGAAGLRQAEAARASAGAPAAWPDLRREAEVPRLARWRAAWEAVPANAPLVAQPRSTAPTPAGAWPLPAALQAPQQAHLQANLQVDRQANHQVDHEVDRQGNEPSHQHDIQQLKQQAAQPALAAGAMQATALQPQPQPHSVPAAAGQAPAALEARPLATLRGEHASRRALADAHGLPAWDGAGPRHMAPELAGQPDLATAQAQAQAQAQAMALAAGRALAGEPAAGSAAADGAPGSAQTAASVRSDELRELVQSCCARLWVQAPAAGAAQGVMLQLDGWMRGCSIELVRGPGGVSLTLRGMPGERRARLAEGLAEVGEALAQSMGCAVVLAVDDAAGEGA
ncbi:hypothetical protein [Aquabacterium sp. OR-4]|uniref:hypothetical protein n=1 Tax=Aquabacterium sp. OR-4 TaxID=2978127 RepID=UPI0021B234CA|nr:hypothetical protein [Aquabacterium sp. OR-4]MDT7836040.1 hypothetical protein [Aquabacterium sp. OR-4]